MASNNHDIHLKIGTVFSGEGLQKCQNAVNQTNAAVKKAAGAAGKLSGALGGLDGASAKAIQGVSELIVVFSSLNLSMITVHLAIMAITKAIEYFNRQAAEEKKKIEEIAKACKEAKEEAEKLSIEFAKESFSDTISDASRLKASLEAVTKAAAETRAAITAIDKAEQEGTLTDLEIERFNKLMREEEKAAQDLINADFDVRAAKMREANVAVNNAKRREEIEREREDLDDLEASLKRQLARVIADEATATKRRDEATGAAKDEYTKKVRDLIKAELELGDQIDDIKHKRNLIELKREQAAEEAITAEKKARLEVAKAERKQVELIKAQNAEAGKRAEDAIAAREKAEAESEVKRAEQSFAETTKKAEAARKAVADAEKKLAEAEKRMAENFERWQLRYVAASGNLRGRGFAARQAEAGQRAVDAGFDESMTVAQDERNRRAGERAQRDRENSREAAERNMERIRYARLSRRRFRDLSVVDQDFVQKYESRLARENAQVTERERAKAELAAARDEEKRLRAAAAQGWKDVGELKRKLEELTSK